MRIVRQLRAIPAEFVGVEGGKRSSFSSRGSRKEKRNGLKESWTFLGGWGDGQLFAYFPFSPGVLKEPNLRENGGMNVRENCDVTA